MLYIRFDHGFSRITPGELLFADDFTDPDLSKKWEITGGEWSAGGGVCTGVYRLDGGGLIYSRAQIPGDVLLDFYGTILSPCTNDLNFSYRARGWDFAKNDADVGYISGLNGWYLGRAGIERYPELKLQSLCENFTAEPDREYHIQAGIAGHDCFLAVDGKMLLTLTDPDPISAPDCCRVGLGTYCSQIRFRDFRVYRPVLTHVPMHYTANF